MPRTPKPQLPKVKRRKLGQFRADGRWIGPGKIEIDPRLGPQREMEVLIHEFFHDRHPHWTEEKVTSEALLAQQFLWEHGYRKVIGGGEG
jgi:hypothetical protein